MTANQQIQTCKVTFKKGNTWIIGYIYDKYRDIVYKRTHIGYGTGDNYDTNIVERANPISVDFYTIVEITTNKTYKVECSEVEVYYVKYHKNRDDKQIGRASCRERV